MDQTPATTQKVPESWFRGIYDQDGDLLVLDLLSVLVIPIEFSRRRFEWITTIHQAPLDPN